MKFESNKYRVKYLRKEKIGENVFNFYFEKPKKFTFSPGQYIKFFLPHINSDERGTSRYFTISSSINDKFLRITTYFYKSSFKKTLLELKTGEYVNIVGPVGYFDFTDDDTSKIFIAGGIGITPFISLLGSHEKINSNILLINSVQYARDVLFIDDLKLYTNKFETFKYLITLTREKSDVYQSGRINIKMIKENFVDYKNSRYFIVGSIEFENEMYKEILRLGIPKENIFRENFTDL